MKLYKVAVEEDGQKLAVRFAGSMAEVRSAKNDLAVVTGVNKKKIDHEEVEIASGKQGLLTFLNEEMASFDMEGK